MPDPATTTATPPETQDPPTETPPSDEGDGGDEKFYRVLKFQTKEDADEHYNGVFKARHRRMKKEIEEEIEDDLREKISAELSDDSKAAEKANQRRTARIETLEDKVSELEGELEAYEDKVEEAETDRKRYSRVIEKQWDSVKEKVPDHIEELIKGMDVLERMKYLDKHPNVIAEQPSEAGDDPETPKPEELAEPVVIGSTPTPTPRNENARKQEADKEAADATAYSVRQAL